MNYGLHLHYFGLLNILSPVCCLLHGRDCKTCYVHTFSSRTCISQERMCDGFTDCSNGMDERECGYNNKHCSVLRYNGRLSCPLSRVIEVDDAWFDDEWFCLRNSSRQSFNSRASNLCNNKQFCFLAKYGTLSAKVMYYCKDKDAEPTRQTTKLTTRKTYFTFNYRTSKSTSRVAMTSPENGETINHIIATHLATSSSTLEFTTSVERHAQASPKHTVKINKSTTNNEIHKTIGKCNCSSKNHTFGDTHIMTTDRVSTLSNNQRLAHTMQINNTFMKHDTSTDNRKQKSQVAPIVGSVTGVMFVICLVLLFVAVRRHILKKGTSKGREQTAQSTSNTQFRNFPNSLEGQNNIPLYSSVSKLTKSELGETMPQSKSISNIGYDETCEFSVQNEDYDHIERVGRRGDVDMVYSLTSYQKTEDDYDISGNFNETLRSYQENFIYD